MTRSTFSSGSLNSYEIRPDEVQPGDYFGMKIVAVVWEGWNCWCAYKGPPDWDDDRIKREGDPISYEVARMLFPTLDIVAPYSNP